MACRVEENCIACTPYDARGAALFHYSTVLLALRSGGSPPRLPAQSPSRREHISSARLQHLSWELRMGQWDGQAELGRSVGR